MHKSRAQFRGAVSTYDKREVLQKQRNLKAKKYNKYQKTLKKLAAEGRLVGPAPVMGAADLDEMFGAGGGGAVGGGGGGKEGGRGSSHHQQHTSPQQRQSQYPGPPSKRSRVEAGEPDSSSGDEPDSSSGDDDEEQRAASQHQQQHPSQQQQHPSQQQRQQPYKLPPPPSRLQHGSGDDEAEEEELKLSGQRGEGVKGGKAPYVSNLERLATKRKSQLEQERAEREEVWLGGGGWVWGWALRMCIAHHSSSGLLSQLTLHCPLAPLTLRSA